MKSLFANFVTCTAIALSGLAVQGQVYVESRSGGKNFDRYVEDTVGFPNGWANSTSKSSASGTTAGIGSRFNSSGAFGAWFEVNPKLPVAGGTYQVHVTVTSGSGAITATANVTQTGCTGLPATTTAFSTPGNVWNLVGTMTLDSGVDTPIIRFEEVTHNNRFYADAVRFTLVQPCLDTPAVSVNGPLAVGTSQVTVTGVTNTANKVTVYQDSGSGMVSIGALTSGIVNGTNLVTVSGLVKGAKVTATQKIGAQEGCVATTGPIVGGGANPRVRIAFDIRETSSTGPIGANGGNTGRILHLGASTLLPTSGIGAGPAEGAVLQPSSQWQTVQFQRGVDPAVPWNVAGASEIAGDFGVLEAIAFAIDDLTDSGPYDLFIDNVKSGTTLIQDFESATNGQQQVLFQPPSNSGTTEGNILVAPNSTEVSSLVADTGTKSLRVRFQWKDLSNFRWLRLTTLAAQVNPNPQVDLNQPISMRFLLLPVGQIPVGAPVLSHTRNGNQITFTWSGSFVLQEASSVTGTWNTINGAISGHQVSSSTGAKFYRLRSN